MKCSYGAVPLIEPEGIEASTSLFSSALCSKYRPDVDGLRALAVISVLISHMNGHYLPGGFVGVDIFFVISGFVVTGSLLSSPSTSVSDYFIGFYARRLKRLAPTLLTVVAVTGLAMAHWIPLWIPQRREFFLSGALSLLGWSNNYFAASEHGYFDTAPDTRKNPFTHTWSLGVEEQFYFVFPLFLLLAYGPRAVKTGNNEEDETWVPLLGLSPRFWLGFVLCCSAVLSAYLTVHHKTLAFYVMPSRLWELMLGALLFDLVAQDEWVRITEHRVVVNMLNLASILLISSALLLTPKDGLFPFPWALVAVAGTMCFIAAGTSPQAHFNACLSQHLPVYLGKISYAVYLWHWPVLVMLDWVFGDASWSFLQAATTVAGILALSAASYHLIEQPVRRWHPEHQYTTFLTLGPIVVLVMLLLYMLHGPLHNMMQTQIIVQDLAGARRVGFLDAQDCAGDSSCVIVGSGATLAAGGGLRLGGVAQESQCFCRKADPTLHTPPLISDAPDFPTCFSEHGVALEARDIWTDFEWDKPSDIGQRFKIDGGPARSKPAVFLIGDSHAVHMRWTFSRDCRVLRDHSSHMFTSWASADDWSRFGNSLIAGDVVVLSYQFEKYQKSDFFTSILAWVRNMSAIVRDRQAVLMLLGDVPRKTDYNSRGPTKPGPECVPTRSKQALPLACKMSKEEMERELAPMYQMWQNLSDQPNVFFFDFYQLFCGETSCNAMIPGTGTLAYMDGNHMTHSSSLYLRPYMCSAMTTALHAVRPGFIQSTISLTAGLFERLTSSLVEFR